jgi:hypothetical protein
MSGDLALDTHETLHRIEITSAVSAEKLTKVEEHLARLNGRVAKSEERISTIENMAAEARGAWKFVVLVSAIPASIIGAVAVWIAQHGGK